MSLRISKNECFESYSFYHNYYFIYKVQNKKLGFTSGINAIQLERNETLY